MPKLSGLELIKRGKDRSSNTRFILMDAFGSIDQALEAIHAGAEDYFIKPFDFSEVLMRVKKIESSITLKNAESLKIEESAGVRLMGIQSPSESSSFFQQSRGRSGRQYFYWDLVEVGKEGVSASYFIFRTTRRETLCGNKTAPAMNKTR